MRETAAHGTGQLNLAVDSGVRLVLDTIPELVWSAAPDGSIDFLNQRWQEYSKSAEGGPDSNGTIPVHPEDRQSFHDEWRMAIATERAFEKEVRVRRADGEDRWLLVRAVPQHDAQGAIVRWFGSGTDIGDRKRAERMGAAHENEAQFRARAEQALEETSRRLVEQSRELTELTAEQARGAVAFDERLSAILESTARTLGVERVSVWEFSEDRSTIRCVDLCTAAVAHDRSGQSLLRQQSPRYFDALERERLIAAHDAHVDERTAEFSEGYLTANGIGAMLDVPLREDDLTVGVLCLEHAGGARIWSTDEQNFALSVANLIAAAHADAQRRHALARLAESEARARLIVDMAHDAFIGIDSTGQIVTWNAQAEATFGWTRAEAMGRTLEETIIPATYRAAHVNGIRRFHDMGEAPILNRRLELTALHRSGREFPIEITITSPMPLEKGYFFGAFLRDISDRHERDAQLRHAKESAEAATRAKTEFLANMSHELRTPLNGVLGYSQLLRRDQALSHVQRESIEAIARCGSQLLELINDILDLSKIEAGRVEIDHVATDLVQLTDDLRYVVAEAARRKGLRLTMQIAPDVPRAVVLDGRHLRQVLLNLLGNAIKFTVAGEVRLAISRGADDRMLFEVVDTGIGIEPEAVEEIFETFTQTAAGKAAGGTGLGLAISHQLIQRMGDELRVESVPQQGSRFYFSLPLVRGDVLSEAQSPERGEDWLPLSSRLADGREVSALVADDSSVNRRILTALLESVGVRVITAAGGREALELAGAHRPDIVFMDLRMSDLDGLEATRRLRADPATAAIPVVAVTANALGDTRQAAFDAGCVGYLPKPIRAEAVFAALQSHLAVQFGSDQPAPV